MRYMFLIYYAESAAPQHGAPEFQAMMERYRSFTQEIRDAGQMEAGDPLQGRETATTDGPFAETKEILGGYHILDCKDLDEALARAAQIPTVEFGSIEVRSIWDMSA